jgi:hypothetical protein
MPGILSFLNRACAAEPPNHPPMMGRFHGICHAVNLDGKR